MVQLIGAHYLGNKKARFCIWAPALEKVSLHIVSPSDRLVPLAKDEWGYWSAVLEDIDPGARYFYHFNGEDFPDPASYYQPEDVLGASCLVDHGAFSWKFKNGKDMALQEMVIYELHVGTFTPEGNFKGVISKLNYLKELGVNAIEIMPVAQFPGEHNWGYDGVFPFAVQHSYGGPDGLKALVNAAHTLKIAVILDVVYNHLGPVGNTLEKFMPCFSEKYKTPWGQAINFDGEYSYGVRNFFISNALYWFEYYHVDALRLDAIHAIYDTGARHFLTELSQEVDKLSMQLSKKFYLIAESDLNDARVILSRKEGGHGMDAQWSDDFHHSLHALLTGERQGYYTDFGEINHLAKAFKNGFVYTGEYSRYRKRCHGGASDAASPVHQLVTYSQNHDQAGNRPLGERLSALVPFEALKLAAAAVLFSPSIPLLFMGEEFGEDSPFLYFTGLSDFRRSKLYWEGSNSSTHRGLFLFYQHIISLRRNKPVLSCCGPQGFLDTKVMEDKKTLKITRRYKDSEAKIFLNFSRSVNPVVWKNPDESWKLVLDSSDKRWLGPGRSAPEILHAQVNFSLNPLSCVCYERK